MIQEPPLPEVALAGISVVVLLCMVGPRGMISNRW